MCIAKEAKVNFFLQDCVFISFFELHLRKLNKIKIIVEFNKIFYKHKAAH